MACFVIASKASRKAPIDLLGSSWRFGVGGRLSGLQGELAPPSNPDSDPKMNGYASTDCLWSQLQCHFAVTHDILGPGVENDFWTVLHPCKQRA